MFENQVVAIKRLSINFYDIAQHEISSLQDSGDHPNIAKYYYCTQQSNHFLYIALELFPTSLLKNYFGITSSASAPFGSAA